jgi:16S rRNA U1498 N3-methylase RsmE
VGIRWAVGINNSNATTITAVIMHKTEVANKDQIPQYPMAVSIRARVMEKIIQLLAIMIFAF